MVALVAPLLEGCAASPNNATGQAPQSFPDKVNKLSTVGEGAVIGAVIGGLSGLALGGKSGAGIGAGIGALLGAAVGNVVADAQNSYANKEEHLAALITDARKQDDELSSLVASSRSYLQDEQQQVAQLRVKVSAPGGLTAGDVMTLRHLQADAAIYQKAIKAADKHLDTLRTELADYTTKYPDSDSRPLQTAIADYVGQRAQLVTVAATYDKLMKDAHLNAPT